MIRSSIFELVTWLGRPNQCPDVTAKHVLTATTAQVPHTLSTLHHRRFLKPTLSQSLPTQSNYSKQNISATAKAEWICRLRVPSADLADGGLGNAFILRLLCSTPPLQAPSMPLLNNVYPNQGGKRTGYSTWVTEVYDIHEPSLLLSVKKPSHHNRLPSRPLLGRLTELPVLCLISGTFKQAGAVVGP